MKVYIISFSFSQGGAAIAAKRFSKLLCEFTWLQVIKVKADSADKKKKLPYFLHFSKRLLSFFLLMLMDDGNPVKHSLNIFSSRSLLKVLRDHNRIDCGDTVWNFHWFNNDLLSVFRLSMIPRCSVITLHDEWLYCGASHCANVRKFDESYCNGYSFFQSDVRGFNWNYVIWKIKYWQLLNRDDLIITVPSSWMLERARSSVVLRGKDIRLLPNPISTDVFFPASHDEKISLRASFGLSEDDVLICLGAVNGKDNPLKGYDLAEKAFIEIKKKVGSNLLEKVCLVFFGHGAFKKGYFHGFRMVNVGKVLGASGMRDIFAMCDWTLVPSEVESFGQVAAESLSCETPVISFNYSGVKDVVKNGVSGFLAEPYSWHDYAGCIISGIMMDSASYQKMGKAGRRHVEEKFSNPVIKKTYLTILNDAFIKKNEFIRGAGDV